MVDDETFTRESSAMLPSLYRVCQSILRAHSDAQDAVQQALLKAWTHRNRAKPESFRAWLMKIAINESRNVQRSRMRIVPVETLPEEAEQISEDWALREAMAALPEKLRTPLLLKYMEGYSEREIASALSIPVTTVKNRLFRARNALRNALSGAEVTFE